MAELENQGSRDSLVLLDHLEILDSVEARDQPEQLDCLARLVDGDRMGSKDLPERLDFLDLLVLKVSHFIDNILLLTSVGDVLSDIFHCCYKVSKKEQLKCPKMTIVSIVLRFILRVF